MVCFLSCLLSYAVHFFPSSNHLFCQLDGLFVGNFQDDIFSSDCRTQKLVTNQIICSNINLLNRTCFRALETIIFEKKLGVFIAEATTTKSFSSSKSVTIRAFSNSNRVELDWNFHVLMFFKTEILRLFNKLLSCLN